MTTVENTLKFSLNTKFQANTITGFLGNNDFHRFKIPELEVKLKGILNFKRQFSEFIIAVHDFNDAINDFLNGTSYRSK